MDQKTYLSKLKKHLKSLPKDEQVEVLEDYEGHFEYARSKGKSDAEIIKGLGDPQKVARETIVQYEITKADKDPSFNNLSKAVFAALGLGVFNLLFVLVPLLSFLFILAVLFSSSFFLILSPVILLIQDGFTLAFLKETFSILGFIGLGILIFSISIKVSKLFYRLILKYLAFNLRKVRGKLD